MWACAVFFHSYTFYFWPFLLGTRPLLVVKVQLKINVRNNGSYLLQFMVMGDDGLIFCGVSIHKLVMKHVHI
jgi:hypothetical protein